jgi:uncharacterized protein (DUF58 family)
VDAKKAQTMQQTAEITQLLNPEALSNIGQLELLSLRVVDGFLSGKHRSTHKGGCFEFAEHRAYTAGDEIRLIDWRVFAKSDRYYVKQFEEETNLQAVMVLDSSGSMQFGMQTVSKFDYARMACACLSRLMLRQRDAVGLALTDSYLRGYIPPRANASHLQALLQSLRVAEATGGTTLAANLHEVGKRMKRRGLVVVFSDCLCEISPLAKALHLLRMRGHEVLLFHILAPEEISFSFESWSRFQCLELGELRVDLDPPAIRRRYLDRLQSFVDDLKRECARTGCEFIPMSTEQDLGETLALYLGRRAARSTR